VIRVIVEGDTEELFVKQWLLPSLRNGSFRQQVKVTNSKAKLIADIAKFADSALSERSVSRVFFLLDLYPERDEYEFKLSDDLATKVEKARNYLLRKIDKTQRAAVKIHFSVHEIEAWVLCNCEGIQRRAGLDHTPSFENPESVDSENPPKKRLEKLWRERRPRGSYSPKIDGPALIRELDLKTVQKACPHFAKFVADILSASA